MKKRWYLIAVIAVAVAVAIILLVYREAFPRMVFLLLESMVCLCVVFVAVFYYSVFRSMRAILSGMDLLREQDFSSRLTYVHQHDADRIVDMFNAMIGSLREERLRVREQSHLMDLLIDKSPMGVIMLNGMDVITSANPAAMQCLSASSRIIGCRPHELNSALGRVLAMLKNGDCVTVTLSDSLIYRCSRLTFMDKGYKHPFFIIEPMTREVREAQKESYGKVIRVLSHEVNNSMTAVSSILNAVSGSADAATAELINVCVQRCQSLSAFITGYANVVKIPPAVFTKVSMSAFIKSADVLMESMCVKQGCTLVLDATDDFSADIDTVLMEQALINIVKNSIESIRADANGGNAPEGHVWIALDSEKRTLTVTDDGPGISDEASHNLFKPFFSTKTNGQGIGLIFIAEVLARCHCEFSLQTCADGLTRFTITFPTSVC